jgi:hypothetical protein
MKKHLYLAASLIIAVALISWGNLGHRAIGKIAENHLSDKAKAGVKNLLGSQTLPDVANWADEIRSNPAYKYTGPWHYANVPAGLNFEQFSNTIKTMPEDNIYKMIMRCMIDLSNAGTSKTKKVVALKYLVHLVGDAHQPMHVSHAEDRGGNSIAITFKGAQDNLHAFWDSGLIEHQGYKYEKMATVYDTATPEQIAKWQSDPIMLWLWESYQIAEILYKEAAENPAFDEQYYNDHMETLQNRIEKGGIRLAGLINNVFDK